MDTQWDTAAEPFGAVYTELRPLLFSIAYRMLSSVSEAEDAVQEAFLRYHRALAGGETIASPKAFLTTVITRLAIDTARSARVRRETYIGEWLPEPLTVSLDPGPEDLAETNDSLSLAMLTVLQTLTPVERAVFLLREAFDYSYDEIGAIMRKNEDNCRQIFARAKKHVEAGKPRYDASLSERQALATRFLAAAERGDLDGLVSFLAKDVTFTGDGGGKAHAYPRPLLGRERASKAIWSLFKLAQSFNVSVRPALVNGQPGIATFDTKGRIVSVVEIEIADGAIQAMFGIVNPDKLASLGYPVAPSPAHGDAGGA